MLGRDASIGSAVFDYGMRDYGVGECGHKTTLLEFVESQLAHDAHLDEFFATGLHGIPLIRLKTVID